MPKFNYLPNNKSDFPHIDNINTFKYDNDFDYGRFDYDQMSLTVCTVPWDMGEAHIGNRTIAGIGNVVYFDSKQARDKWFADLPDNECYRFTTKFKELHRDGFIDVPIPYDMCAKHNYLVVHYEKFANENSPVQYEGNDGLRDWFWFIREVEFLAPNTTRLHIMDDAFQTWIYDVNVSGMVLERGHAPMFATRASEFLDNPIEKNEYLLTEDVNFGEPSQVKHIDAIALNAGDMYACIATTAYPPGTWGSKAGSDWKVPARSYNNSDGTPSVFVFAVAASSLDTFLSNIDASIPQFKQTIQGIFFASSQLVTTSGSFTFASTTCYYLVAGRKTIDFVDLEKSLFGYSAKYDDLAKLYTSPYAHIEICDENGATDIVRIEDTTGTIKISAALSLAYPFINIDAHLLGVGGSASASVTFKNLDSKTFPISGQWYDTLKSWNVPTFAVVQESSVNYDYATDFDRKQRVVDYTTAYDNATASAATAQADAVASANTRQANENANADAIVDNADTSIANNNEVTNRSILSAWADVQLTQDYNNDIRDYDNIATTATASATIAADEQQAAISASSAGLSTAVSAVSSALSLDFGGAVGSVANGVIGTNATLASTSVGVQLTATNASLATASNTAHTRAANDITDNKAQNQTDTQSDIRTANNDMMETIAATNSATIIANASRTQATETGNAARDYATAVANAGRSRSQAQSAIANDIAQAALKEPLQYGAFENGDSATTKPMAMFAHIVTQSKSAIASAGDEFLRYGYQLDRQWEFDGNWNVGKYFTYWKLRDFWVTNLNVPDMYMDKLRFFLFGGVTVWRKPEYIGKVTIYDNFS